MMTVTGLSFSLTMLTLQLASSQFGPRLLRTFMRDSGNQVVLGTFLSTFIYCLLVLRTVKGVEGASFVPHISVAFGLILAIASLAVLIYFIHHVAVSIRIEFILAELADEIRDSIARLFPEQLGHEPSPSEAERALQRMPADFDRDARTIRLDASGYVQHIDDEALLRVAAEHDLIVRVDTRPGRFITRRDAILSAYPRERAPDEVADSLRSALILGPDRTPTQDIEFSLHRIVEIAQRALSPGTNDPTTALYCIDRLGEALLDLSERSLPTSMRFGEDDRLRVVVEVRSFDDYVRPPIAAIARYGLGDADVVQALLRVVNAVAERADPDAGKAIRALGEAIRNESRDELHLPGDRPDRPAMVMPEHHEAC